MLEITLIYKDIFYRLKLRDAQYKTMPSEEDWENAKFISEKLKFFTLQQNYFLAQNTQQPTITKNCS
jgi:hypothetical protein